MIKFNKEEISLLKELVPYLGIDNEEKEHRKYSSFYYSTFYTFKESDIEWFEDDYIPLFHKVVGFTIGINGMWDDSNGLEELSLNISVEEKEINKDYNVVSNILNNNNKDKLSESLIKKILSNIPEFNVKTTKVPFCIEE